MSLVKHEISKIAKDLLGAARTLEPLDPLSDTYPEISTDDAYKIQLAVIEHRVAIGHKIIGKKIGLTSPAIQTMLNVNEPDYGHLLDDMILYEGEPLVTSRLIQPRIEGEIAFILKSDLAGPGVTPSDVVRSTDAVTAALEIIDSRVRDWKIKIQDTVADNASSAAFVLGSKMVSPKNIDLRYVGFVMLKNGRLAATGAGAAVLGSPIQSVAWLANKMGEYGITLKAGEIILSGSAIAAIPVAQGDSIQLTVDRLGTAGCFCS